MTSLAHSLFHHFENTYTTYSVTRDIEMEMRIGRTKPNGTFDSSIPREKWEKLKSSLNGYGEWELTDHQKYTTFRGRRGIRLNEYKDTGERVCVRKTNMEKKDFVVPDGYSVRFSASTEKPVKDIPEDFEDILERERWSYVRKNTRIDLTMTIPSDKDAEDPIYEVELEFLPPFAIERDVLFKKFYKVFDLLRVIMDSGVDDSNWATQIQS